MAGGGGQGATIPTVSLQDTPTWALATVCFIMISVSLFIEHLIHLLWSVSIYRLGLFKLINELNLLS